MERRVQSRIKVEKKHESKFNELSEKEDRNDFGQRLPLRDE